MIYDPYAVFKKHVLPNGLTIYHAYYDRPWVKSKFVIHSGSREDEVRKEGTSHFVEHLVSENIPGMT